MSNKSGKQKQGDGSSVSFFLRSETKESSPCLIVSLARGQELPLTARAISTVCQAAFMAALTGTINLYYSIFSLI